MGLPFENKPVTGRKLVPITNQNSKYALKNCPDCKGTGNLKYNRTINQPVRCPCWEIKFGNSSQNEHLKESANASV